MRFLLALVFLIFSSVVFGKCQPHGFKPPHEPRKETIFGGCDHLTYSFRAGYSSEYDAFGGVGLILPLDQTYNWEGYFSDAGLIMSASKYSDLSIYDFGFIKRGGWLFTSRGWEAGLSYATGNIDNYGIYAAYHFIGLLQVRVLKKDSETEYSVELGLKF